MEHREIKKLYVETNDMFYKYGVDPNPYETRIVRCDRIDSDDNHFHVFEKDKNGVEYLIAKVSKRFPYIIEYER